MLVFNNQDEAIISQIATDSLTRMDLFSNFCNICYKTENRSLTDISKENMKHLSDSLITFVAHAAVIEHNAIYLCQFCCEELTRFDKFREMCLSNLIELRQRYLNMKLELKDNACEVQNTLQKFVYDAVLRQSSLENSNCPVSISTDCYAIINSSGNTKLEKFEGESNEDFDVPDTNNGNGSDTSQIDFMKEEFHLKNEIDSSDSKIFTLTSFENELGEHANFDIKVPVVNNSEGNVNSRNESRKEELHTKQEKSLESLKLETIEDEFGDGENVHFEFVNVCPIMNMEECGKESIRSGESKAGIKLRSVGHNNKLTAATIDAQSNHTHVREYRSRRSSNAVQLAAHNRVYPSVEVHTCTVCNKSFRTSTCLTRHSRTHNHDRPYKCNGCNKTFSQSATLATHKRTHSGSRPYKCTVCNKTFTTSSNLARHGRTHSGARPYKCPVCNKTFTQLGNLTTHERTHSGARPYRCTGCNKTFNRLDNLTIHERIHSGSRPYKCTVCNKTFTALSNFIKHGRLHSGTRP